VRKQRIRGYWLGIAALLPLLTGCGGLHATGSVSPIDFLLPGAGRLLRVRATPQPESTLTNTFAASSEFVARPIIISNPAPHPTLLTASQACPPLF